MEIRARYIGTCQAPKYGEFGNVFPAGGFNDPESAEYQAWMFEPDSEQGEGAYYLSREDWEAA